MSPPIPSVATYERVDAETFRHEIVPAYRPALLKGLVGVWPVVEAAKRSPRALRDYLLARDTGAPVEVFIGPPSIGGRFFYNEAMRGFNFERQKVPLTALLDRLLATPAGPDAPAIYAGSLPVPEHMPGLAADNAIDLIPAGVPPRIWIGNATVVSAHYDNADNIACAVGGRRRFTFFPPDQVGNLYVGPLENTMAGQPASLVELRNPDFDRFPRFREALAHAQTAELEPGDAVYIPSLWWHHVEAPGPFNVLVNYWWSESDPRAGSAFECLIHGLLTVRDLPEPQREAWRAIFDHYLFGRNGDPAAHLPPHARGILGPPSSQRTELIKGFLRRALGRP